jgi:hypothetical protein
MDVDRVLKELQGLGALGLPKKPGTSLEESDHPSGTWEQDPRIGPTLEALDHVRGLWNDLLKAQVVFERALGALLDIWVSEGREGFSEGSSDDVGASAVASGADSAPLPALKVVREPGSEKPGEDAIQRAREAARRKILGEDLTEDDRQRLLAENEEDDTPFVGQIRARVATMSTGEAMVGTLGKIKASLPTEG